MFACSLKSNLTCFILYEFKFVFDFTPGVQVRVALLCACAVQFEALYRMAADSSVLLGLVEEFVSGQVDSKAIETATGSLCLCLCRLRIFLPFSLVTSIMLFEEPL